MELLDVFDKNGKFVGTMTREEAHKENAGVYHKPVHIWFVNSEGGGSMLVQKRASTKKQYPSKWDIPSAGHVDAGEDLLTACQRETREELGINLPKERFVFQCETLNQKGWEFAQHYLVTDDTKVEDMALDPNEVEAVKWLSLCDFEKLLYSDEFVPHMEQYKSTVLHFIKKALKER
ncbi:MAG: NUDIX domain-containing protein [Firmicutes bacterium]|nr:NUDIX domain-containing protein [Bacillota bacterium]